MELIAVTMKRKDCGVGLKKFVVDKEYFNACFPGAPKLISFSYICLADEFINWGRSVLFLSPEDAIHFGDKMMKAALIFPLNPSLTSFLPGELYRFANFVTTCIHDI